MRQPEHWTNSLSTPEAAPSYCATPSVLFRYGLLSFQGTGYYRRTKQTGGVPDYDSWGYGEQAGYFLVPEQPELAERVSGVWWGQPEISEMLPDELMPQRPLRKLVHAMIEYDQVGQQVWRRFMRTLDGRQ